MKYERRKTRNDHNTLRRRGLRPPLAIPIPTVMMIFTAFVLMISFTFAGRIKVFTPNNQHVLLEHFKIKYGNDMGQGEWKFNLLTRELVKIWKEMKDYGLVKKARNWRDSTVYTWKNVSECDPLADFKKFYQETAKLQVKKEEDYQKLMKKQKVKERKQKVIQKKNKNANHTLRHLTFKPQPDEPEPVEEFHATTDNYKQILVREAGMSFNKTKPNKVARVKNPIIKKFITLRKGNQTLKFKRARPNWRKRIARAFNETRMQSRYKFRKNLKYLKGGLTNPQGFGGKVSHGKFYKTAYSKSMRARVNFGRWKIRQMRNNRWGR